jgi:hypothetical protein
MHSSNNTPSTDGVHAKGKISIEYDGDLASTAFMRCNMHFLLPSNAEMTNACRWTGRCYLIVTCGADGTVRAVDPRGTMTELASTVPDGSPAQLTAAGAWSRRVVTEASMDRYGHYGYTVRVGSQKECMQAR